MNSGPRGSDRETSSDFIVRLADALRPLADATDVQHEAMRRLGEFLNASRAFYCEVEGVAYLVGGQFVDGVSPLPAGRYPTASYGESVIDDFRAGRTVVMSDVQQDARLSPAVRAAWADLGCRGVVGVPLVKNGQLVAILGIHVAEPREWTPHEVALVEETAERTWASVERARAEQARLRSEAKYRALFESVDEGVCFFERLPPRADGLRDYRYLAMNRAMREMFGIDDLTGRTIRECFPHESESWYDDYDRVLETGVPIRLERESAPQGMVLSMFVSRVEDGAGPRLMAVMQDITLHTRAKARMAADAAALIELNRLSSRLWQMADLQAGLEEMLSGAIGLLRADMGHIQLLDARREVLVIHAHRGFAPAFLEHFADVATAAESAGGRTLRASGHTIIEDVDTDESCAPLRSVAREAGYRAVLATPLTGRSGPSGVMSVHFRSPHRPDDQELRLLDLYARQAADFIDRLQADAAVRENEQRYRALFEKIDEGFCIIEFFDGPNGPLSDYVHVEANPAYERHAGIANVVGQKVREMVPDEADGWVERYRRVLVTGEPIRFERELVATGRHLELSAFRIEPAHRRQVAVLFQDVTDQHRAAEALRESEHRFRQIADTMAHMIWVTRPDGFHEWYNQRWYEFTGVPEGSTDGEAWNGMFHAGDQARAWATWRHSLATGDAYEIEYRLRHHTGEYRWVLGRALPIRNERGEIERWFGTCTDIHAMRQLTEEREHLLQSEQAARVESERAGRMKDEFLATLSHEIRTPLNAILGWATLLRSGQSTGSGVTQGLEIIERNARLQAQMIEDLLDMSRIISGKLRLDVQRLDLADVIRSAAETVETAAAAKEIRLQLVLDPLTGPVTGDANRLQQVFWNLLSNAIKFTPKGGRVQVLLERVNSHLEVSVIDTGEGIEPAFLPQIFDRFRQADATTTRRHGGLGLGLAIVKQLIELHGGTIRAKSPGKGQGATFVASLPLTVIHPDAEPLASRRHPSIDRPPMTDDGCVQIAGTRVLVVDDEPDARSMLQRLFEECNAVVRVAASAAEALTIVQMEAPDVLISDIGMPGEDGYTLIRRVRALPPEKGGRIPAIALTAYARTEDRVKSMVSGFQHHLSKPIEPSELIAVVARLVDTR